MPVLAKLKYVALDALLSTTLLLTHSSLYSQEHKDETAYQYPTDTLVRAKLTQWQNLKFGLFLHWGPYSQRGIVESWTLSPEDYSHTKNNFTQRTGPDSANYFAYTQAYERLGQTFNPTRFTPQKWAAAAKAAGMKYMVFTTKHHDGFCMFDTKYTDYRITNPSGAFAANPRSNLTKEIFDAFRTANFMVGAYYSKPDWHSDDFWWRYFPPKDRNPNYDTLKHPERWKRFYDFTANQLNELTTAYGKVDLLWFDGDWVKMNMMPIANKARQHQPGLIIVERHGNPQLTNYLTPEQKVPDHFIAVPWETCMTMGESWSYKVNEHYKSARQLIQTLIDIVAKNGNLLLNIGPGPDGEWHDEAYQRLNEIAAWMKNNGQAIFDTKPLSPYRAGKWAFTQNQQSLFAFYLPEENEKTLPARIVLPSFALPAGSAVSICGTTKSLSLSQNDEGTELIIPQTLRQQLAGQPAWVFKIDVLKKTK